MARISAPLAHSQIPKDVYPVLRVSTEFFLRGFDLLSQLHSDVTSGIVFMTIWHGQAVERVGRPASIRELARKLALPNETVRRHIRTLELDAHCIVGKDGPSLPAAALQSPRTTAFLRGVHGNGVRLLGDLARIGVAKSPPELQRPVRSNHLSRKQMVVATAATGLLLVGMKALREFLDGDLMKGLVYTAVWAANVKHITNAAPTLSRTVLDDKLRLPISILAISNSLRLPYETIRRHVDALVKDGLCVRSGRQGVVVPATVHHGMAANAVEAYRLVMSFVSELQAAGVKV